MSEQNGTNGANAVEESPAVEATVQAVAAIQAKQRGFSIPAKLAVKLAEARSTIEPVSKNGRNKEQNYTYVQAEDVVAAAGKALAEAKVVVMPPEPVKVDVADLTSARNSNGKFFTVTFLVRVIDGETGEGYETERIGTASDYPGDKAIYKAETGMMKYFLSSLLQIPLGDGNDDPESTSHGAGGAVSSNDSSPASDKQKDLFKSLLKERQNMPKPARQAIVSYVGGENPKKGAISHAIDQLMNAPDPLEFAKECGWDGTVEDPAPQEAPATEASATPQQDPVTPPETTEAPAVDDTPFQESRPAPQEETPASTGSSDNGEGDHLIAFLREIGLNQGEVVQLLRAVGVALPPDEELTLEIVHDGVRSIPANETNRFRTMARGIIDAKDASSDAATETDSTTAAPAEPEPAAPATAPEEEVDPGTPLGAAIKELERMGYSHELAGATWLMFDTNEPATLPEEALNTMVGMLSRAHRVGIQAAQLSACIRGAREGNSDVKERAERFESWIANREDVAQQVQDANRASEDAEGPQE